MILSQIGYYSLIFVLAISILILFFCFKQLKFLNKNYYSNLINLNFLQFLLVVISFSSLIFSFLNSQFINRTVYENSHTTKPFFYKLSGTWGNHEGSLLLWILVLIIFSLLFLFTSQKKEKKYLTLTLLFQQIIILGFLIFTLVTSNPFDIIFPIPNEGLGLNPILQDPALAVHPPILYIGYVGCSIIFSSSLAALMSQNINGNWASHIKKWAIISWIFLTVGIMLGSIWAYYELGWGGFWFWDPVENVSLMPWLTLTALIHSLAVIEKKSQLKGWVIILSISTFVLSVAGTFLVRSGILNSIHTFANDPQRGIFILIFLFLLIFLSLIIFFKFHKQDLNINKITLTNDLSILINNWFMMYFLSVVLIGTIYPIFLEVINDTKISVGPPFFNKLISIFLIPFLLFMGFGASLGWLKSNFQKIYFQNVVLFFISIIISSYLFLFIGDKGLFLSLIMGGSIYLFLATIRDLIKRNKQNLSQRISHFGFSLLVLSILFNSIFSEEYNFNLSVGEKFKLEKESIFFKNISMTNDKNFKKVEGVFLIKSNNNKDIILKPQLRIYNQPVIITSEADILSTLYSDNFIVMNKIDDSNMFNIRYQKKPLMIWIWISTIIIALGGTLTFFKYRK